MTDKVEIALEASIEKMKTKVVNLKNERYDIYIGRPSRWGNPYIMGKDGTREEVIEKYREWIVKQPYFYEELHTLKGKRLGCFCKPLPCHGEVLIELVEKEQAENAYHALTGE